MQRTWPRIIEGAGLDPVPGSASRWGETHDYFQRKRPIRRCLTHSRRKRNLVDGPRAGQTGSGAVKSERELMLPMRRRTAAIVRGEHARIADLARNRACPSTNWWAEIISTGIIPGSAGHFGELPRRSCQMARPGAWMPPRRI